MESQAMEALATEIDELYDYLRHEESMWAEMGFMLTDAIDIALDLWPKASPDERVRALRARVGKISVEVQYLVDRANMPGVQEQFGDKYMSDGAKEGEGGMDVLNPNVRANYFAPETSGNDTAMEKHREKVRAAGKRLGLSLAEQTSITVFTTDEYKYINPATDNNDEWMLANRPEDVKLAESKLSKYDRKVREAVYLEPRKKEGAMHAAFALKGLGKLPVWTGPTYRGEAFTKDEFSKKFKTTKSGKHQPPVVTSKEASTVRKAIASTSRDLEVSESFGVTSALNKGRLDAYVVIWQYELINGRDIEELSNATGEAEVATLPGATFTIGEVVPYGAGRSLITGQRQIDPAKVFMVKCQQTV